MNKFEELGAKIISSITIGGQYGWPPDCFGLCYQPERPVALSEKHLADNEIPESDNTN